MMMVSRSLGYVLDSLFIDESVDGETSSNILFWKLWVQYLGELTHELWNPAVL